MPQIVGSRKGAVAAIVLVPVLVAIGCQSVERSSDGPGESLDGRQDGQDVIASRLEWPADVREVAAEVIQHAQRTRNYSLFSERFGRLSHEECEACVLVQSIIVTAYFVEGRFELTEPFADEVYFYGVGICLRPGEIAYVTQLQPTEAKRYLTSSRRLHGVMSGTAILREHRVDRPVREAAGRLLEFVPEKMPERQELTWFDSFDSAQAMVITAWRDDVQVDQLAGVNFSSLEEQDVGRYQRLVSELLVDLLYGGWG